MYAVTASTFSISSFQKTILLHVAVRNMSEHPIELDTLKNEINILASHAGESYLKIEHTEDLRGIEIKTKTFSSDDEYKIITIHPICQ